jgi:coatomer protein complex subunit epsilon
VQLMGATILANEGNYVDAMKCCHTGLSLELNAMMVSLLCKIDRP